MEKGDYLADAELSFKTLGLDRSDRLIADQNLRQVQEQNQKRKSGLFKDALSVFSSIFGGGGSDKKPAPQQLDAVNLVNQQQRGDMFNQDYFNKYYNCLLYTSPSPRDS